MERIEFFKILRKGCPINNPDCAIKRFKDLPLEQAYSKIIGLTDKELKEMFSFHTNCKTCNNDNQP